MKLAFFLLFICSISYGQNEKTIRLYNDSLYVVPDDEVWAVSSLNDNSGFYFGYSDSCGIIIQGTKNKLVFKFYSGNYYDVPSGSSFPLFLPREIPIIVLSSSLGYIDVVVKKVD